MVLCHPSITTKLTVELRLLWKTSLFLVAIADLKRKSYVANEGKPIPMSTYDSITFFVLSPCYGLTLTETTCRTLGTRQLTTLDIYERQRMFDYG